MMKPELTPAQINDLHERLRSMRETLDYIKEILGVGQPKKKSQRQPLHEPEQNDKDVP
jgi:hypothetical protein